MESYDHVTINSIPKWMLLLSQRVILSSADISRTAFAGGTLCRFPSLVVRDGIGQVCRMVRCPPHNIGPPKGAKFLIRCRLECEPATDAAAQWGWIMGKLKFLQWCLMAKPEKHGLDGPRCG